MNKFWAIIVKFRKLRVENSFRC